MLAPAYCDPRLAEVTCRTMGVRTRNLDMIADMRRAAAEREAIEYARRVVEPPRLGRPRRKAKVCPRSRQFGNVHAVFLPYEPIFAVTRSTKSLKSLARPTGIEPVFPP
jgi:hypothetical protein